MAVFLFAFFAIIAGCCAVMIVPAAILAKIGFGKASLLVALASTSALVVDYQYNWDAISYPHWLVGLPTWLFPFTFPAGLVGVAVGGRSAFSTR